MGYVVGAAQWIGQRVYAADAGVGEAEAGDETAPGHGLARSGILAVRYGLAQVSA